MRTNKNIIIEINQETRIPRTFNRFCGLMAQLMQKFKITASDNEAKVLMRIVNPPVTAYFPENAEVHFITRGRDHIVSPASLVPPKDGRPLVIVVAASDKQDVMASCAQFATSDPVSLSNYEMTAEFACFKMCKAVYDKWIAPEEEENDGGDDS